MIQYIPDILWTLYHFSSYSFHNTEAFIKFSEWIYSFTLIQLLYTVYSRIKEYFLYTLHTMCSHELRNVIYNTFCARACTFKTNACQ